VRNEDVRALAAWTKIEVLRMPAITEAISAETLIACLVAWPRLRKLQWPDMSVPVTDEVLEALNRSCPMLAQLKLASAVARDKKEYASRKSVPVARFVDFLRHHPHLIELPPVWNVKWANDDALDRNFDLVRHIAQQTTRVRELHLDLTCTEPELVTLLISLPALESVQTVKVASLSDATFLALRSSSNRPLHTLWINVLAGGFARLTDAALLAIADVCPRMYDLTIIVPDTALAASHTHIAVGTIRKLLARCPNLCSFSLYTAPLQGLQSVTDDLRDLVATRRLTDEAEIEFYVVPGVDVSDEWTAWCKMYTHPLHGSYDSMENWIPPSVVARAFITLSTDEEATESDDD
jgi:hypothetical protein